LQHLAIYANIAKLIDDECQAAAIGALNHISNESGFTGA
jgi:hypothetical protein